MAGETRDSKNSALLGRRDFLIRGSSAAAAVAALGLPRPAWAAPDGPPRVRRYTTLGRTGLKVSDISFGSSRSADPALVEHAFARGINYFDCAESYKGCNSELAIGRALRGKRDEVYLTSKVKCGVDTKRSSLMQALERSLKRLQTDHVDIYFNHAVNDIERLKNDEWLEFATRAKQQGKIRFAGMSGHGGQLVACMDYALDHDLVDVILCAYNFGQDPSFFERLTTRMDFVAVQPDLPRVLAKAREKNVGLVAMKTLRGARLNDMRPYEWNKATFAQAALRWVLAGTRVDALVISMTSIEQIDEFVAASGGPAPRGAELDLLEDYLLAQGRPYCNHACDACESSCPHGVAISEVLRTRMYAVDYGDLSYARDEYAELSNNAQACATCVHTSCVGACPQDLQIPDLTREAHRLLA